MRVSNVRFEDFPSLKKHIAQEAFSDEKFLLVQFFDGRNDEQGFRDLTTTLVELLPHATILGVTTAGEILDGCLRGSEVKGIAPGGPVIFACDAI